MNMFSESQLASLKKIVLEELGSDCDVEKIIDKTKTPAFSELVNLIADSCKKPIPVFPEICDDPVKQDFYEASAKICEELEIPTELLVFLKDKIVDMQKLPLSFEENFRNGIRLGQEWHHENVLEPEKPASYKLHQI